MYVLKNYSKKLNVFCSFVSSASPLHSASKDEKKGDSSPCGQLSAAQMHGQWKPSTGHCVAEGRHAAHRTGGRGGSSEEVDSESQEPDARAQRQIHL